MLAYATSFLVNFSVILSTISLFFAVFIAVFWYRRRVEISEARPRFNYFMEKFFVSKEFNWLVFSWAMLEALIWFVIPEFLLILVIFMKVRKKVDLVIYDILGTLAGTVIGLVVSFSHTDFLRIPYVYQSMLDQVTKWYDAMGVWGLANQPFSGVPYKVFLHQAHDYQFFWISFLFIAIIARMVRYIVVYQATKLLYPFFHRFVRKHYAVLFAVACAVFTLLLMRVTAIYS